ncbi:hypothetical protein RHGRI_018195 [Rhododendron griersonianum]|uniref:Uncharacterized protein n=1 Tax=Rhododendron griersonianum TaxID=479676 RepID=A0AAV6K0K1_9ERIC|nr:hypothetical protein RHGRI_018195 [Rhododendron griersonianum]
MSFMCCWSLRLRARFSSKSKYIFGKVTTQIKLVEGDFAETVTPFYVTPRALIIAEYTGVHQEHEAFQILFSPLDTMQPWPALRAESQLKT